MNIIIIKVIFSFLFSFFISFYLIPLLCDVAQRLHFVDYPDGKIKLQNQPIPYLGGVAVYSGFLSSVALVVPFDDRIFPLIIGITLLLFIGLIDDLIVLRPYQKFFGQSIVAFCFLKAGFYLKEHFFHNIWNLILSLLWILSVINAFNLVDVMDGLTAILAISATITFMAMAFYLKHYTILIVLAAFLGSIVAFFWYNKPPATMYLGDAGSLFIGGFLSITPFFFDWGTYNWYGYLTPPIVLAIPLLECATLILIRSYKRIPFFHASPDHFSLYLIAAGWCKEDILRYIMGMSAYIGVISFLFMAGILPIIVTFFAGIFFIIVWFTFLLKKQPAFLRVLSIFVATARKIKKVQE